MWEDLEIIIKTKATDSPSKPKTPSSVSRFLPLSINQPLLLTQNCHPWKNNWAPPLNASLTYLLIQIEPMFHISCGLNFLPFLVPLTKHYTIGCEVFCQVFLGWPHSSLPATSCCVHFFIQLPLGQTWPNQHKRFVYSVIYRFFKHDLFNKLKTFLRALILMTQVSLYLFFLPELISKCIMFLLNPNPVLIVFQGWF